MVFCLYVIFVFFFKQKTAYDMRISDWSSDVCSSDLFRNLCGDGRRDHGSDRASRGRWAGGAYYTDELAVDCRRRLHHYVDHWHLFRPAGRGQSIMGALYKGFLTTAILSIPALYLVTWWVLGDMDAPIGGGFTGEGAFTGMDLFWSMMVGLAVTGLIVWITEYYTGTNYRPVKSIAKASVTGHGTNVIQGLAISLEATALPTLVICVGIHVIFALAVAIGLVFGGK